MNKRAQQVLSGIVIAMLVTTVFSIGFMTESMEVKDKNYRKWSGLSVVSGMAVLDTVVDSVAEEENALAVSTKDDSFYIIRKRGGEWYYSDTPVKVNVDHMDAGFKYYLVSEVPEHVEIRLGAPYFNKITGMATGMEGVSGMVGNEGSLQGWKYFDTSKKAEYYVYLPVGQTPYNALNRPKVESWVKYALPYTKRVFGVHFSEPHASAISRGKSVAVIDRSDKDENTVKSFSDFKTYNLPACFLPTTPITLSNGDKKQIQNIIVGDKVLSYDLENKKSVVSTVLNTFHHKEQDYLIINGEMEVTPYHYVYAKKND